MVLHTNTCNTIHQQNSSELNTLIFPIFCVKLLRVVLFNGTSAHVTISDMADAKNG